MPRKKADDEQGGKTGTGRRTRKGRLIGCRAGRNGTEDHGSGPTRSNDV